MATKLELQEQIIDKLIRFMLEKSVELSFNTNDINVNPNEFIDNLTEEEFIYWAAYYENKHEKEKLILQRAKNR